MAPWSRSAVSGSDRPDRVLALAEELGLGLFPTYLEGDHLLGVNGAVERYGGEDFAMPEDALADISEVQERLTEMAAAVPLDEPWRASEAAAWDAQTVDAWLVANAKTENGLGYWRTMVPALFSADTAEMSLLHFLFYCRSGAPSTGSSPPTAGLRRAVWWAVRSSSRCGSPSGWATLCGSASLSRPSARTAGSWR